MKKSLTWILSFLISFSLVFLLFVIFELYTIGDIPTKLVLMRYIASSLVGGVSLYLLRMFMTKNKDNIYMIISVFTLIPFIMHILFGILLNIFPGNRAASNSGAIGILIMFLYTIFVIPCIVLAIISLIKGKEKKTKVLSIISIILWSLILLIAIRIYGFFFFL